MTVLISAAVATAAFVAIALAWGILHLRHSIRTAEAAIREVTAADVPALRDECVRVFSEAFGDTLDLDDFEGSAQILSGRLDQAELLKRPFARPDRYWHFVLPIGAFMGELLRVHTNGTWRPAPAEVGGLELAIPLRGDFVQTFPFHKVIKHVTSGDPGDVYAYFMSSRQLGKLADRVLTGASGAIA
jgi:hypothetical protein